MPSVHDNTLAGNRAVWTVGSWLTRGGCLVRPVAADTDIGIDLYCESTVPGAFHQTQAGFLHFFVQVKCGGQIHVLPNGRVTCNLKSKHLSYWSRQPVPVFVFLVPGVAKNRPERLHVIDVTRLMATGAPSGQKTMSLESDATYDLSPSSDPAGFLNGALTAAHVLHACLRHGICEPFPELFPGYVQQFPSAWGYFARNGYQILRQVRASATHALLDLLLKPDVSLPSDDERRVPRKKLEDLLAGVLMALEKHGQLPHWDSQRAVGLWNLNRRRRRLAERYFHKAERSVNSDSGFHNDCLQWKDCVETLKSDIAACQHVR